MMKKRKLTRKGVSPLVATVLLVGFTVSLVALTVLWSRGYIEERAQKEEKLATTQINCEAVQFMINDAEQFGMSRVDIDVENKASTQIDGFVFRIKGDEVEALEWRQPLEGIRTMTIQLTDTDFDFAKVGAIQTIEAIPLLKAGQGTYVPCSGKMLEVRVYSS